MKSPNKKGKKKRVKFNARTKCVVKLVSSLYSEENANLKIVRWRKNQVACDIFLTIITQIFEIAQLLPLPHMELLSPLKH